MATVRYIKQLGSRILCDTRHLRELRRIGAIRKGWRSLRPNLPPNWTRREYISEHDSWTVLETKQGNEWLAGDPVPSDKETLGYILGRQHGQDNHIRTGNISDSDNGHDITSNPTGKRQ